MSILNDPKAIRAARAAAQRAAEQAQLPKGAARPAGDVGKPVDFAGNVSEVSDG
jgi:hypothetical protein